MIHYSGIWKMTKNSLQPWRLILNIFVCQIPSKKTKLQSVMTKLPSTNVKKATTGTTQRQSIAMHIIDENVTGVSLIIRRICSIHDWSFIRFPNSKIIFNHSSFLWNWIQACSSIVRQSNIIKSLNTATQVNCFCKYMKITLTAFVEVLYDTALNDCFLPIDIRQWVPCKLQKPR